MFTEKKIVRQGVTTFRPLQSFLNKYDFIRSIFQRVDDLNNTRNCWKFPTFFRWDFVRPRHSRVPKITIETGRLHRTCWRVIEATNLRFLPWQAPNSAHKRACWSDCRALQTIFFPPLRTITTDRTRKVASNNDGCNYFRLGQMTKRSFRLTTKARWWIVWLTRTRRWVSRAEQLCQRFPSFDDRGNRLQLSVSKG